MFLGQVDLRQDPDNPSAYVTLDEIRYVGSQGDMVVVPVGRTTDLASVPRALTWFIPQHGVHSIAAIVHDHMCRSLVPSGAMTRRDADGLFRKMLGDLGVPTIQRRLMWAAVRAGSHWSDATPRERVELAAWSTLGVATIAPPTLIVVIWLQALRFLAWAGLK